jgi:DNA-binding SARP family transcriptional activator/tetratricopeptide (TPR) repeat protein
MAAGPAFSLLGPLAVCVDGAVVPIPPGKQRVLMAALLLQAGRMVSADELAETLWGTALPPSATVTLQNYVKRLRRALGSARDRIVTQPGGYMIRLNPAELDVTAMEEALASAHQAVTADAWADAAARASAALALWRGEPLCDIDSGALTLRHVPRLLELRFQARELRIEAGLQLGGHAMLVTEARQLTVDEPLREHPRALLIRALHGCGRRAEALQAYRDARIALVEELGCEPGSELQALHREILDDAPNTPSPGDGRQALPVPSLGVPAISAPSAAARQLPAAVSHFTGRAAELETLTGMLNDPSRSSVAVTFAVAGTAGVGKTALAVHWAHQVARQFPDGQLYVNLRGYGPYKPLAPADALTSLLGALGVPGQRIPDGVEDRAALYRSRLAGRRVLVVLDNARDGEQVRPLLPGDPTCVTLVTSRDTLAGLVATNGARRLDLGMLPLTDAVRLLRSLIGSRAYAEPEAAAELATLCARLPLALRIAAEQAAARPGTPLPDLVGELAADRLDCLDAGEERADVRAVFSWSHAHLPDHVARAFALISLHPGEELDAYAAAALCRTTPARARRMLGSLQRASLLQTAGPGRYSMHDLLRAYAREQATARETRLSRRQALTRLADYYRTASASAMDIVFPAEAHQRPRIGATGAVVPQMRGEQQARAWMDAERENLVALVVRCANDGLGTHVAELASTLFRYLMAGSHVAAAVTIYSYALQAARSSGDVAAEADALNGLGSAAGMRGRFTDATDYYQAALESYYRCGNLAGEARVLNSLGITQHRLRNFNSAIGYHSRAIATYEHLGDSFGAARALAEMAFAETSLNLYDDAAEHLQRALQVFRDANDRVREAQVLSRIGELHLCRGQLADAAECFDESLAGFRRASNPTGIAAQLYNLGDVALRQGDYRRAVGCQREALDQFRRAGDEYGEAETRRSLAEALLMAGEPAEARAELEAALPLAAETGNTYQLASAHRQLGDGHHQAHDDDRARTHWQQALALYTQLGAPEADHVRSQLIDHGAETRH